MTEPVNIVPSESYGVVSPTYRRIVAEALYGATPEASQSAFGKGLVLAVDDGGLGSLLKPYFDLPEASAPHHAAWSQLPGFERSKDGSYTIDTTALVEAAQVKSIVDQLDASRRVGVRTGK